MKKALSQILAVSLCLFMVNELYAQLLDPDGTRNYWINDNSGKTADFLKKFQEDSLPLWKHCQGRLDGYCLSRKSVVALNTEQRNNTALWQAFQQFGSTTPMVGGMNSGLMNKSWEFNDPSKWMKNWSGDIAPIKRFKEAGFKKIIMYMQSVLSKGQGATFNPDKGGATLATRIQDAVTYASYIESHKPDGIEVTYALIDAFPTKSVKPEKEYRQAYLDLVIAFQEVKLPFVGIMIDMKSHTVNNSANKLIRQCKWIETELSATVEQNVWAGWWSWNGGMELHEGNKTIKGALTNIHNHSDSKYVSHICLSGNSENNKLIPDIIPQDSTNTAFSKTARVNQAFSIIELDGVLNPINANDPILGPSNTSPPSRPRR